MGDTKIADLYADLTLRTQGFLKALHELPSQVKEVGGALNQAISGDTKKALKDVEDETRRSTWTVRGYIKDTSKVITGILIAQGFYRLLGSIEDSISAVYQFKAGLQEASIGFSLLLGSRHEAEVFLRVLEDFAATTPFVMDDARVAATQLMAMGFQAKQVIPLLRVILDTAAMGGADPERLRRIVVALGQIRTTGRALSRDLNQLAQAGIPVFDILREKVGWILGAEPLPAGVALSALISGLEERFGGASQAISLTVTGLSSTIRDNLLIIGGMLSEAPFNRWHAFLMRLADGISKLRDAGRKGGIGGMFAFLVPPALRTTVKEVLYYFIQLGASLKQLWGTFKPLVQIIGTSLLKALSLVLPWIVGVVKGITAFVQVCLAASPFIRYLGAAIGTLMIAQIVHALLVKLVGVTVTFFTAGIAGKAVAQLAQAIRWLWAAMAANPLIGVIMILAGALLYLAMQCKEVSAWLDRMSASLSRFFVGAVDLSNFLAPSTLDVWGEEMGKYSSSLEELIKSFTDVGGAAEEAKNSTDKFLASFDEVYQIPEKAQGLGDLESILDMMATTAGFKLPSLEVPDFGELSVGLTQLTEGTWSWAESWDRLLGKWRIVTETIGDVWRYVMGTLGAEWNFMWTTSVTGVKVYLRQIWNYVIGWLRGDWQAVSGFFIRIWDNMKNAAVLKWNEFVDLIRLAHILITAIATNTWEFLKNYFIARWRAIGDFFVGTWEFLERFFATKWQAIKNLFTSTWQAMKGDWEIFTTGVQVLFSTAWDYIANFFSARCAAIKDTFLGVWSFIKEKFVDLELTVLNWTAETAASIIGWVQDTSSRIAGWATTVKEHFEGIRSKFREVVNALPDLLSNAWQRIVDKARAIVETIKNVFEEIADFFIGGGELGVVPGTPLRPPGGALPGAQRGLVIDKEAFVHIEGGRKEGIFPLTEETMAPFARMIGAQLALAHPGGGTSQLRPLYVGNLIATKQGLRELYRKMAVVEVEERARKGEY